MSPAVPPTVTVSVQRSAAALLSGHLVAFPTETVYGLGALADDPAAVARVFAVKGRPPGHPLIVHLPSITHLEQWGAEVPAWAQDLAHTVWPGPLTLVVPRAPRVSDAVTGGQPTVGLRVPSHPVALELLAEVGTGVAAPSANPFGRVSPTSAAHVVADLSERLEPGDLILDGGECGVGLESTIILAIDDTPRLLRPGALSAADVSDYCGREVLPADHSVRAPGTLPSHYAPRAAVVLADDLAAWAGRSDVGVLCPANIAIPAGPLVLGQPEDSAQYARTLYSALRAADAAGLATVVIVPPPGSDGLALAVRDRLRRAAAD